MLRSYFPFVIISFLFFSCKKDRVSIGDVTVTGSPVIAMPLGKTTLTLEHIVNPNDPNDTLVSANNNTYQVVIAQPNVVNTGFDNLVSIPSQSLINRTTKMGSIAVDDITASQSVSLDDISTSAGGAFQSGMTVSVSDINTTQTISLNSIANDAGGTLQSSLSVGGVSVNQSITLDNLASNAGGALQSNFEVSNVSTNQSISLEAISNDAGGAFQSSLTISNAATSQDITLGNMANDIGGSFQTNINLAHGGNGPFPSFTESNVGTYSGGSLGNFTSATMSSGSMTLEVTNNWPVPLNMNIDLVNTTTNSTIVSYSFLNVASNGGTSSQIQSLVGKVLPSNLGFKIVSVSSPGSGFTAVAIDTSDAINLDVTTANMIASSYIAPFPSLSQTNLGTYGGGSVGSFTSATFDAGIMSLSLTNNWPVALSMGIDLVDTTTNTTIVSYVFSNVAANGGSSTQSASLIGKTLPNTTGLKITSVQSSGSSGPVSIVLSDAIILGLSTSGLSVSSLLAPFPAISQTNVGTYSGGSLGSFSSASFSGGSMNLSLTNDWPVALSLGIELIDTTTGLAIVSFNFSNVAADGGLSTQTASLVGKTIPSTTGLRITTVSSPGATNDVTTNMSDSITLGLSTSNLVVSSFVAPFPSFSESNVGTYSGGAIAGFTSASFSGGSLTVGLSNHWPVSLSMSLDLVNTANDSTLLSYSFSNVAASGGTSSQSQPMSGITLPNTLGFKVVSVSSPGSNNVPISVDMLDTLSISITGANLTASSFVATFPAINQTNVGTYSAGSFSTFSSASFSQGNLSLTMNNEWPVDLSMGIDIVDMSNSNTLLSYAFSNVAANGGSSTQNASLIGVTLPNSIGLKINSVTSAGSPATPININLSDSITFAVGSSNLKVYNATVKLDTTVLAQQDEMVDLGIAGVELEKIAFQTCDLNYEFVSTLKADVEVVLTMLSTDKNGSPIDTTILIVADQTTAGTISLANTILDLTTDSLQSHSRLPIALITTVLPTASQITVDSSQYISALFDMDNIDFEYIQGYFGDTALAIPSSTIPLDLDILDQFDGEVTFENPSISIGVTNSVGIPIGLDLDFTSYRNGTGYSLNAAQQVFPYPSVVGDSATGTIVYDNTNSAIANVFTFPSDSIAFGGMVTVNPDTVTFGKYNFITSDSKISGDLLLEIPFEFTTANLSLEAPVSSNLNLSSLLQSDLYELDYARLKINTFSTLPLDATMTLRFYGSNGALLLNKPLSSVLLESGTPNANGVVITGVSSFTEVLLTSADFDAILNATELTAQVTLATYNGGTVPVKLRTDANITIELGMEVKVKYELL